MWEYTDKVIDHFLHPRNVGEVQDAALSEQHSYPMNAVGTFNLSHDLWNAISIKKLIYK